MRMRKGVWYQVDGDINGMAHGCTLAMFDGYGSIHVRKIQPVIEYVGEQEGSEVGYPFWTRDAVYDVSDIRRIIRDRNSRGWAPLDYVGLDIEPTARINRQIMIEVACAALDYGHMVNEGPAGWSRDVLPDRLARGRYQPTRADGYEADAEYRAVVKEYSRA